MCDGMRGEMLMYVLAGLGEKNMGKQTDNAANVYLGAHPGSQSQSFPLVIS
jgi:hypothetical protein